MTLADCQQKQQQINYLELRLSLFEKENDFLKKENHLLRLRPAQETVDCQTDEFDSLKHINIRDFQPFSVNSTQVLTISP